MKRLIPYIPTDEEFEQMVAKDRKICEQRLTDESLLNPTSARFWFPKLQTNPKLIPHLPRTTFVLYNPYDFDEIINGKELTDKSICEKVKTACDDLGYSCFIRTDMSSAKHDGPTSYKINGPKDIEHRIRSTFYDNAMKDLSLDTSAFMIREFLILEASFTAFDGLPIAREWRLFADKNEVKCSHFYWTKDAFNEYAIKESPCDWEKCLSEISGPLPSEELALLKTLALEAVKSLDDNEWSVDFACDIHGNWWLIDMALAQSSWHPEH